MKIFEKMKLLVVALALTTAYSGCCGTEPPPASGESASASGKSASGCAPPAPLYSSYYADVLILAESPQKIGTEDFGEASLLHRYLVFNYSKIHTLSLGSERRKYFAEYATDNTGHWNTYGLGNLINRGDKPVYVLTGTFEEPYAVRKILKELYPNNEIQFNANPTEITPPFSADKVRDIVAEYRKSYKPVNVGSNEDFPGLSTIKPGKTRPVIHASIAPKEWRKSERGHSPGADIPKGISR